MILADLWLGYLVVLIVGNPVGRNPKISVHVLQDIFPFEDAARNVAFPSEHIQRVFPMETIESRIFRWSTRSKNPWVESSLTAPGTYGGREGGSWLVVTGTQGMTYSLDVRSFLLLPLYSCHSRKKATSPTGHRFTEVELARLGLARSCVLSFPFGN